MTLIVYQSPSPQTFTDSDHEIPSLGLQMFLIQHSLHVVYFCLVF